MATYHAAQFSSIEAFTKFALAGNATFTIVSRKTGQRFTFRIRKGEEPKAPHFVSVLTGPENTSSYTFMGAIFAGDIATFALGKKSRITREAPSFKAITWLFRHLDDKVFEQLEIWHQGRCGKCRKKLTVPASIASGLGPVCAKTG